MGQLIDMAQACIGSVWSGNPPTVFAKERVMATLIHKVDK